MDDEYLIRVTARDDPDPTVEDAVRRRVRDAGGRVVFVSVLGAALLRVVFYLRGRNRSDAEQRGKAIVEDAFEEVGLQPDELHGGAF